MEKSRMLCCDFSVRFFGSIFRFDFSVRLSGSIFRFDFASVFCKGIVERGKGVAFFFFLLAILWPKTHGACIALTFFFFFEKNILDVPSWDGWATSMFPEGFGPTKLFPIAL